MKIQDSNTLKNADEWLCTNDAAKYIKSTDSTMSKWRITSRGPRFSKSGRKVLYKKSDLDNWLNAHQYNSTSEYQTSPDIKNFQGCGNDATAGKNGLSTGSRNLTPKKGEKNE